MPTDAISGRTTGRAGTIAEQLFFVSTAGLGALAQEKRRAMLLCFGECIIYTGAVAQSAQKTCNYSNYTGFSPWKPHCQTTWKPRRNQHGR
jgi:hypothetical protein